LGEGNVGARKQGKRKEDLRGVFRGDEGSEDKPTGKKKGVARKDVTV